MKNYIGKFVTAKLAGEEDCRQGWVVSVDPLRIQGQDGEMFDCEGKPIVVINPPMRRSV